MIASEDDGGSKATKPRKAPAERLTVEQAQERRMAERLTKYRAMVARAAAGEQLLESEMAEALDLLESLQLPGYAFVRDTEALLRYQKASEKLQRAIDAQPAAAIRAAELTAALEHARSKIETLREELHHANAKASKPSAYEMTLKIMEAEFPHLLDTMDRAVAFRIEQQKKRLEQGGGA